MAEVRRLHQSILDQLAELRLRNAAAAAKLRQSLTCQTPGRAALLARDALAELEGCQTAEVRLYGRHRDLGQPVTHPLSEREVEVLRHVANGLTNQDAAAQMHISANTVKRHLDRVAGKLGTGTRLAAVLKAQRHGYDLDGDAA